MNLLPPLPGWEGMHPLVIHFPIALLLVAPVLVVLGLALRTHGRSYLIAALVVMLLGTIAAWVAVGSGKAAGELAEKPGQVESVMERHEELGETTRTAFTALTVLFALLVFGPGLLRRSMPVPAGRALGILFLVLYAGGALLLVRTAHQGGLLVHEYGVHALVAGGGSPAGAGAEAEQD